MIIEITRPDRNDVKELHQLFDITIRDTFEREGIVEASIDEIMVEVEKQKQFLRNDLDTGGRDEYFLIARRDDRIVGTIAYGPPNHMILKYSNIAVATVPEIKSVYIHPDYQRQGIGTKLLMTVVDILRDRGFTQFCLDTGYKSAQVYWQKKLGPPLVTIADYYSDGTAYMIWVVDNHNPLAE